MEEKQNENYKFHIDAFNREHLCGWICNPLNTNEEVSLALFRGNEVLKKFTANQYREDLEKANLGANGRCAFFLNLNEIISADDKSPLFLYTTRTLQLVAKLDEKPKNQGSHFKGLWIDDDFEFLVKSKNLLDQGVISYLELEQLMFFKVLGYLVLPQIIPEKVIEDINSEMDQAWTSKEKNIFIEISDSTGKPRVIPISSEYEKKQCKLLDFYIHSESARCAIFNQKLLRFLQIIFENNVLAFQSLSFLYGSEQPMHKDTAFVKVDCPLGFAASWIALEDIEEGSGELEYFEGSHRDPDFLFDGRSKWMADDRAKITEYYDFLKSIAVERNLKKSKFLAKKGDVLIWHSDLTHGGSSIRKENRTRKSLVTHYCPATNNPIYGHQVKASRFLYNTSYFSSAHSKINKV